MADTPPTIVDVSTLDDSKLDELASRALHGEGATREELIEDTITEAASREFATRRRIEELEAAARNLSALEGAPAQEDGDPSNALTAALAAAQGEFPKIERRNTAEVRGKEGKAGYSYTYADLGDVLAAVRPVLSAHGLALTQHTAHVDGGKVLLVTRLAHVAGGELTTEVEVGQQPANPQAFGGALTYLRRYELVTLLGIAAEEDRDAQDVEPPRRNGEARAPELPAWAQAASDERKAAYVAAIGPIVGDTKAKLLGSSVAQSLGYLPDVVVGYAKALAIILGDELGDAIKARAEEREAEAAREAQDRAAEQPDPPAPEEDATARIERMKAETAAEVEAQAAAPAAEEEPETEAPPEAQPIPGTVDPPAIPEGADLNDVAVALTLEAAFRQVGCICPDPLAPDEDNAAHDDACPLKGHGIPF